MWYGSGHFSDIPVPTVSVYWLYVWLICAETSLTQNLTENGCPHQLLGENSKRKLFTKSTWIQSMLSVCVSTIDIAHITSMTGPEAHLRLRPPEFLENQYMKAAGLSALLVGHLYLPWDGPRTHFSWQLSRPHGHNAAEGLIHCKLLTIPPGIETADLQLVTQILHI
jgi:hypothetical protein